VPADPSQLIESDRAVRRASVVLEHMNAENTHEWSRVMATFNRPRYELPDGRVFEGADDVMAYWLAGRSSVPDQRNQLVSLEICAGGTVLLHFVLRGTSARSGRPFESTLWAVFDFDDSDLLTNERVYVDRPSDDVVAGGGAAAG